MEEGGRERGEACFTEEGKDMLSEDGSVASSEGREGGGGRRGLEHRERAFNEIRGELPL